MDAFFASVEQRDRPELRGKPVLVGSDRRRGVVAAASYEARIYGCHSAQPMSVALRRCPHAVVVRPDGKRYGEASERVFSIFEEVAPKVEPLSIDEAFLDLTGTERLLGPAVEVARGIKRRVREEVGITASVGIAPNKFLAKLASDLEKPDGLTIVTPETIDDVLLPLPVERIWGVGPKTAERLHALGIRKVADLRALSREELERRFGASGDHFWRLARGLDDRAVVTTGEAKSISHEQTFEEDLQDPADVRRVLLHQTEAVARRLRRHGLLAKTVTLKIRYGDFETITRSTTLDAPTDVTAQLWEAARGVFDRWVRSGYRPVRLIGMGAAHLGHGESQLTMFPDVVRERMRKLDAAVDRIQQRFGSDAIRREGM
jgi:DNA polymerase-4